MPMMREPGHATEARWWRYIALRARRAAALGVAALVFSVAALLSPEPLSAATPQMEAAMEAAGRAPAKANASGAASKGAKAAKKGAHSGKAAKAQAAGAAADATNVYAGQPAVTEKELLAFAEVLPRFRAWARDGHEEAHPVVRGGNADFLYSPQAAEWVTAQGWQPARFFCVMGRLAAALVIVEEGNDMGTRPADMPSVSAEELALARRHLGILLTAGGDAPPIRQ